MHAHTTLAHLYTIKSNQQNDQNIQTFFFPEKHPVMSKHPVTKFLAKSVRHNVPLGGDTG